MTLNPAYGGTNPLGGSVVAASEHGRARLTKSGGNLLLSPYDGNSIVINDTVEVVPSAGVTLAATGLTIDTDHLIYVFMNGATMTLEASTTGHVTNSATGVEIKSGDSTRTLVGMARPITGPVWVDTPAQRFVISWFNRRTITARQFIVGPISITSTTKIEISTTIRAEFLTWADEMPSILYSGSMRQVSTIFFTSCEARIDTTALAGEALSHSSASANLFNALASSAAPTTVTEGYHFSTLWGRVGGGTCDYSQITNSTLIRG